MLLQPVNNAGFVVNMPTRQDNAPISDLVVLMGMCVGRMPRLIEDGNAN